MLIVQESGRSGFRPTILLPFGRDATGEADSKAWSFLPL